MTNNNPDSDPYEMLRDRLYAEINASDTESPEFAAAFNFVQKMESKEEPDPELKELEKEALKMKIEKERTEIQNLQPKEKAFKDKINWDVVIPAAATLAGVVVIVSAEIFGPAILNSKALNRLPKP